MNQVKKLQELIGKFGKNLVDNPQALEELYQAFKMQPDAFADIEDTRQCLRDLKIHVEREQNTYKKSDIVVNGLLEILDIEHQMFIQLNKEVSNLKGKVTRFENLDHLIYSASGIPRTGYERRTSGDTSWFERKEPMATLLGEALQKLADPENTEVVTQADLSAYVGSGREVAREVFKNPDRPWFYAGYFLCAEKGYPDPVKCNHDPLIDLKTLKQLFLSPKLQFTDEQRELHLAHVEKLSSGKFVQQLKEKSQDSVSSKKQYAELIKRADTFFQVVKEGELTQEDVLPLHKAKELYHQALNVAPEGKKENPKYHPNVQLAEIEKLLASIKK